MLFRMEQIWLIQFAWEADRHWSVLLRPFTYKMWYTLYKHLLVRSVLNTV